MCDLLKRKLVVLKRLAANVGVKNVATDLYEGRWRTRIPSRPLDCTDTY